MVEKRFCHNCGAPLDGGATFCANCGLNLAYKAPPSFGGGPFIAPGMAPPLAPFMPGGDPPASPMSHERSFASMASVILFFNSSVVLIMGMVYILGYGWDYDDRWQGDEWVEVVDYNWDFIFAGIFMIASFVTGLVAGIVSARGTRVMWALTGSTMVLLSGIIETVWDRIEAMSFVVILGAVALTLVLLAREGFRDTPESPPAATAPGGPRDGYGWERPEV